MDCTSFYLIALKTWEFVRNHGGEIWSIMSSSLTILFAWLSWHYSRLAYQRNQFSWKVAMNRAFWDFWHRGIKELVVFSFTNDGHRKWIIRNVYIELNNKKTLFFTTLSRDFFVAGFYPPDFPYELGEMGELSFSMYKYDFEKCIRESTEWWKEGRVKYLCFSDNVWKVYRYKIQRKYWKELFL